MPRTPRSLVPALALALVACGGSEPSTPGTDAAAPPAFEAPGPHAVGYATFEATDAARARTLHVSVWYPSTAATTPEIPLEDLEPAGPRHDALATLVAAAPPTCTRKRVLAAKDAAPLAGPLPLVAFSHCHGCARFSEAVVAERLASHGVVVIAPDHASDTLFDAASAPLDTNTLALRVADVRFALDTALADAPSSAPAWLHGAIDPTKVGVFGHSFGAVTTGAVLHDDARFRAGVAMAAPIADLLGPAKAKELTVPVGLLVALEDGSVPKLVGNDVIERNYADLPGPAFLAEIPDAGHFGVSDLDGLTSAFSAGCGAGKRNVSPFEPFTYAPADGVRAAAAAFVTAFFRAELAGDASARAYLGGTLPRGITIAAK